MKINDELYDKLANFKCDVAYLADIFGKLNDDNLQLQRSICFIKAKGVVLSFINKLEFYRIAFQRHDVTNFVNLNTFKDNYFISEDDMICYCSHLASLKKDMVIRFKDIIELEIPEYAINPFNVDVNSIPSNLVEEWIDLQNDIEAQFISKQ